MTKPWPTVRLGELLTHYAEYIEAPEPREYRKLSVKLYGKGVVLDAPADGTMLKMKRHQLAKAAQIHEARTLRHQAAEEAEALVANQIKALFERGQESGWTSGRLGDYVVDDCYGSSEKTHDDSSGTPVLRMGNIQGGRLDLRNLKYLHIAEKDRAKLVLKRGDIVVNRTNSAELVGKCAVFDEERDFAYASYLIRLRLDTDKADPCLVASFINSPAGRAYMFSERKQMTGQANVNATKLKALPIACLRSPSSAGSCRSWTRCRRRWTR